MDKEGTITESFVPLEGRLVHGNELLASILKELEQSYDSTQKYKLKEYKLSTVIALIKILKLEPPLGSSNNQGSVLDIFIGYIMLDCLISNPDRHHENWGIVVHESKVHLSPTFDHASGLGCREVSDNKRKRLTTNDPGFKVDAYVKRAKTPFCDLHKKKLSTLEALEACISKNRSIVPIWLKKLNDLDLDDIKLILDRIPDNLIDEVSREFALKIIEENRKRILKVLEDIK